MICLVSLEEREEHEIADTGGPFEVVGIQGFQNGVEHENSLQEIEDTFDGGIIDLLHKSVLDRSLPRGISPPKGTYARGLMYPLRSVMSVLVQRPVSSCKLARLNFRSRRGYESPWNGT